MESILVKFKAEQQHLTNTGTKRFASNTVAYIYAEFDLGENWAGFDVVRAVWKTEFSQIATVLDGSGRCAIPAEVLNKCGQNVFVNLVGSIADGDELTDRLTTYQCKALTVDKPAFVDGSETLPITPSQFEQFVEIIHEDAEAAETARDEARGYASDAEGYRDEAAGAAADAKDYRDAAKGYADDAEDYKDQAKGYADDAEADAEEIRNMSATATTLPEGSSATASYSDGVLSLGIPKGDTGATGATGNGIANAVLNADYTLTLNFTDGTHYTTPPIRGAQGIQGETGNGIASIELKSTSGAVKTYEITFTDPNIAPFDFEVTDGEVTRAELASVLPTDTASGSIASFPDGSDLFDYLSCVVDIEPVQAGSGTPSPDNVRPITGWTGCEVNVCGVNLWDEEWEVGKYNVTTGEAESGVNQIRSKNLIKVLPNTTYFIRRAKASVRIIFCDASGAVISATPSAISDTTFDTPNGCYGLKFYTGGGYGTTYTNDISINYPSTDTTYHAHNPNSAVYPVSWQTEAGTVYGGTVDLATGVLTVDRVGVDLGSLNWTYSSGDGWFQVSHSGHRNTGALCSAYPCVYTLNNMPDKTVAVVSGYFVTKDSSYNGDVNAFKQGVNGAQLVYILATPQTYQLTPVQVACLLGQNNVWADCGDIDEVKYKADVQLYIDKRLGA